MTVQLLLAAIIMIACVICNLISNRIGMPVLLAFILLGMFFGSDGVVKIYFDNYAFAEQICSIALIFIMFYGGFGTKWNEAKPVAAKAILLSSLGTVTTAGLVGLFCWGILKFSFLEGFLVGAVISSTDAASVFSILRSKRLNLKYNTASLLEIESGSNDPFSYMLTVILLALMNGDVSGPGFAYMIFAQIVYGVVFGFAIAMATRFVLKKVKISSSGFGAIFVVAVAVISYATPSFLGGNGYLSAYITGIILGNSKIDNKPELVHFFDGVTGLMQILLFFLLGLLSFPSQLPNVALPALCIAVFLTFAARPLAVFAILTPFRSPIRQKLLVSWAGMRGAASIVFAIMAVIHPAVMSNDIFHMVFFIVLFSILLQGTLIPPVARMLKMTDNESNVMNTFNDYMDEVPVRFIQLAIPENHSWVGKKVKEIQLPPDSLLVLISRGEEKIVPNGQTVLCMGDSVILSGKSPEKSQGLSLYEKKVGQGTEWCGKMISEIHSGEERIILVRRGKKAVIPKGNTRLLENDILVLTAKEQKISAG